MKRNSLISMCLIASICAISLFMGCGNQSQQQEVVSNLFGDSKNDQLENPEHNTDNVFKWSIEYPSDWNISAPNDPSDTLTPDGDPE